MTLYIDVIGSMGQDVFEGFHKAIIGAMEEAKAKRKPQVKKRPQSARAKSSEKDDNDDSPSGWVAGTEQGTAESEERQGKLILDATVAPQAIRYPADLSLLNEARELSEQIIDVLYPETPLKKKPRTYRNKAKPILRWSSNVVLRVRLDAVESSSSCSISAVI